MNASREGAISNTQFGRGPARFGRGLTVDGDLVTGEDLVLEGRLNGGLHAPDNVITVAASGIVRGKIFARAVIIDGTVQGDVTATNVIEIGEAAKVEADLSAPAVAIAQGAFVVGKIDMRRADAAARVARYRVERSAEARAAEARQVDARAIDEHDERQAVAPGTDS